MVKNLPAMQETLRSPGQEDPLEKGIATHSSILAWRIPWTEEPSGLQGSQRLGFEICIAILKGIKCHRHFRKREDNRDIDIHLGKYLLIFISASEK